MPDVMHCPKCHTPNESYVYNSRPAKHRKTRKVFGQPLRWRRRRCSVCEHRFSSYEFVIEPDDLDKLVTLLEAANGLAR